MGLTRAEKQLRNDQRLITLLYALAAREPMDTQGGVIVSPLLLRAAADRLEALTGEAPPPPRRRRR